MSDVKQSAPKKSRSPQRAAITGAASRDSNKNAIAKVFQILALITVIVCGGLLALLITVNYQSFQLYGSRADAKAQQLAALQSQHDDMKRRLDFLQLPKGREQVLLEHGYLQPGQRILLFPAEKTASDASAPTSIRTSTRSSASEPEAITQTNSANDLNATAGGKPATASATGSESVAATSGNASEESKQNGNSLSRWWNDVNRASSSPLPASSPPSISAPPHSSVPASTETP